MKTQAFRIGMMAACMALLALPSPAANVLHMANGRKMAFKSIRWDAAKNEFLVQPASGGDAVYPVARKDVFRLEMDAPPEMEQAKQLLAANRNTEAIPLLQTVVAGYRGLNWDNTARELLARIYVKGNEPAKAIKMVDELLAAGAGTSVSAGLRMQYWEALLALDPKSVKAMKDFDDAIATGPREVVPVAQVKRGNLRRAAGRKEEALQDYLRTILFFENAGAARAEALTKAIEIFDELGDAARANDLRQKLAKK
ncbi:MAG: tetratricopeptide repeat protein [bacterium]